MPLYTWGNCLVKQANTRTLRSNTKNLLQIPLTNLKRFGDRAFCAYAPRLWNELPDNIKAADSVQNFKKQLKTLLFRKEFNWLYGPWQLSNDSKALLNIIGGKGAISNINYYNYWFFHNSVAGWSYQFDNSLMEEIFQAIHSFISQNCLKSPYFDSIFLVPFQGGMHHNEGSLQRRRTAWALGHDRVSQYDVNDR